MPIRQTARSPSTFGRPQRELDRVPAQATAADLMQLIHANRARVADGSRVAQGEVAWLAELLAHPAADNAVVGAVRQLVEEVGLSDAAIHAGAEDWFDRLGDRMSGATEVTTPGTGTSAAGVSALAVLSGEAPVPGGAAHFTFAFGKAQRSLPGVAAVLTRAELAALVDDQHDALLDGGKLAKGELAWLQRVANHPNADGALRLEIATRFGNVRLSSAATEAGGAAFFRALEASFAFDGGYGPVEEELGPIPTGYDAARLRELVDAVWKDVADRGTLTPPEAAWVQAVAAHAGANADLKGHLADRLLPLEPRGTLTHEQVDALSTALRDDRAFKAPPVLEEPQPIAVPDLGRPAADLPKPAASLDAAELGLLFDQHRAAVFDGPAGAQVGKGELAWVVVLAQHDSADAALRRKLAVRLRHTSFSQAALDAGAAAVLDALAVGARPEVPRRPPLEVSFGPPQFELGSIPESYDADQLRQLVDKAWPEIADGNELTSTELGWLHQVATERGADATLRADLAERLRPMRLHTGVNADDFEAFVSALERDHDIAAPARPTPPGPVALEALGFPPATAAFGDIDPGLDAAQLGWLFEERRGALVSETPDGVGLGGASWLLATALHPQADAALRRKMADRLRGKISAEASDAGAGRLLSALRAGGPLQLADAPAPPADGGATVAVDKAVEAASFVRDRLVSAAGADGAVSAAEVQAAAGALSQEEKAAIDAFYVALTQDRPADAVLTIDEVIDGWNRCVAELKALDVNGDGLSALEVARISALGAATLDLGRLLEARDRQQGPWAELEDEALLAALREHAAPQLVMGYDAARHAMFSDIDNRDGSVFGVYTGREVRTTSIPEADGPGGMNTEHTRPRSQGVRATAAERDLHHLFPTDSVTNGRRGNYPFGLVETVTWQHGEARLGWDREGRMVFEPPPSHRGNVARALFYVAATYDLDIPPHEETVLRAWHREDGVDHVERQRNERIESYQRNRNAFIDDPSLTDRVDDF